MNHTESVNNPTSFDKDEPTVPKHTPGPWRVTAIIWEDTHYSYLIEGPENNGNDTYIAEIHDRVDCDGKHYVATETVKANAQLIAAAPKMLSALRLAIQTIEYLKSSCSLSPSVSAGINADISHINQAISEATLTSV